MKKTIKSKLNLENILLGVVIIIGVTLSIIQFLYNRSLWLDESYLALNIIDRSFNELLQPLHYEQVAPILFLWIEKLATILFGPSEYALRIFPLLCFWGAIFFFFKIIKMLHLNIYATVLSLLLFIFNGTLIYYSSEVKQYMTDVLVLTCMFYFTMKNTESRSKKYILLGVLGSTGVFLSNVSPIILLCSGAYLLYHDYKNGWKEIKYILIVFFTWLVVFGIYFAFFIYNHPTRDFMVRYWSMWDGGAFLPLNPFRIEFYQFVVRKSYFFYTDLFKFGQVGLYFLQLLFILGLYHLFEKKKYNFLILGLLPLVVHLALSSLKLYPFDIRLILYLCPAFIILLSHGFEYIFLLIQKYGPTIVRGSFALVLFFFLFMVIKDIPRKSFEPRECFDYLQQNIKNEDKIYVSQYSKFPLWYYTKSARVDFSDYETLTGEYVPTEEFDEEIDSLKGRVWFVFSDFLEYYRLEHLKELFEDKHTLLEEYHTNGVAVLLYEIEE